MKVAPVQRVAAPLAAYAAQAEAHATMMSTPRGLMGEAAGKNTRGDVHVTLAEAGKAMMLDSDTLAFTDTLLLQGRVRVVAASAVVELGPEHVPAFDGVASLEDQHLHALQPDVSAAAPVQQQPPRHRVEAQSKLEAHASPGGCARQKPVVAAQPEQPARIELGEQQ